jgi:hypothetical protein
MDAQRLLKVPGSVFADYHFGRLDDGSDLISRLKFERFGGVAGDGSHDFLLAAGQLQS